MNQPNALLRIALLLAALSCSDSNAPGPVGSGHFRANVTGAVRLSLAGQASHAPASPSTPFLITMHNLTAQGGADTLSQALYLESDGPPTLGLHEVAVGTFSLPPTPTAGQVALVTVIKNRQDARELVLDPEQATGTLRITTAGPAQWAGTLTVSGPAKWADGASAGDVQLFAEFRTLSNDAVFESRRDSRTDALRARLSQVP